MSKPTITSDSTSAPVSTPVSTSVSTPVSSSTPVSTSEFGESQDELGIPPLPKKRKLTSDVWNHFERQEINGQVKAVCNYCQKKLGGESKNGTKHLKHHFGICPLRTTRDIRQAILRPTQNKDGKANIDFSIFDQEVARRKLAMMIILHEYPISIVEHIGFREFCVELQPLFKPLSRKTITRDIYNIYEDEKAKTMRMLEKNQSRIAITTDMWTASNQKKGFMVVTAHFVDDSWKLHSRVMRFIYVPCPHTSEVLGEILANLFLDWNIDRKLSTLTVDNCSTNDNMINVVLDKLTDNNNFLLGGELFHMRCCAHILNLIVRDGLDVISSAIENIRDSVAYWTATPKRVEKFEEAARQMSIECKKKLALDCKTRWNSTYLMLDVALNYKLAFSRLKQRGEPQYKCLPTELDWEKAAKICKKLKMFYDTTLLFSGTKYPTANVLFSKICFIRLELRDWFSSSDEVIKQMASSMITKFDKYWSMVHGVTGIATILDPRYKMELFKYFFPRLYGDQASTEFDRIRTMVDNLVEEYQGRLSLDEETNLPNQSVNEMESSSECRYQKELDEFLSKSNQKSKTFTRTELDFYLEEGVTPTTNDFDVLFWWKLNAAKYPTLQMIARDILAIPISTVASESAFSTGGRFVTPHRSRLNSDTLEALMCSQNWLWAEIKDPMAPPSGCINAFEDADVEVEEDPSCITTS